MTPTTGYVQEIKQRIQALTGKELDDNGLLRELDGPLLQGSASG
jgi:hypothetical protein